MLSGNSTEMSSAHLLALQRAQSQAKKSCKNLHNSHSWQPLHFIAPVTKLITSLMRLKVKILSEKMVEAEDENPANIQSSWRRQRLVKTASGWQRIGRLIRVIYVYN